jgi:hypothetical protein
MLHFLLRLLSIANSWGEAERAHVTIRGLKISEVKYLRT